MTKNAPSTTSMCDLSVPRAGGGDGDRVKELGELPSSCRTFQRNASVKSRDTLWKNCKFSLATPAVWGLASWAPVHLASVTGLLPKPSTSPRGHVVGRIGKHGREGLI